MFLLIEPYFHCEVLDAMIRLLLLNKEKFTCISSEFCYHHSEYKTIPQVGWKVAKDGETAILNHKEILKSATIVFCTTIKIRSCLWDIIEPHQKVYAYIHNAHNFFNQKQFLVKSFSKIVRMGAYELRGDFRKNKIIGQRLDKILVPTESNKHYLDTLLSKDMAAKISYLDFAIPKHLPTTLHNKIPQICIPGTLTNERRDYDFVLEILPLLDQQIEQPISISFLGKPETQSTFKMLKAFKLKNIQLEWFNGYIEQAIFNQKMLECDFLWLPIRQTISYKSFYEIRGKSCVSGNINDMVKYALPALLPAFYPLNKNLELLTERYESKNDCIAKLKSWIEKGKHLSIKNKAASILSTHLKEVQEQWSQLQIK